MINPFLPYNRQYQRLTTLRGPHDAVTSLAFSAQGSFLTAVGPAGANVWSLETFQSVPLVPVQQAVAVPVAAWLCFTQRYQHVLLLGTSNGDLQMWDYIPERLTFESLRKAVPHNEAVQVISIDVFEQEVPTGGHAKIIASFADRMVSMWTLRVDGELKNKFSVTLEEGFMPKTVRFDATSGNIYVFAMNGGHVILLDGQTGATIWRKMDAPNVMGSVSLDQACQQFVACTSQGFELFDLERILPLRKFPSESIRLSVPKHASFTEDGTTVVGGTDRGCADVYDVKKGKRIQTLKYSPGGLVQSVATCPTRERFLVAIAGSNGHQASDVVLWRKTRSASPTPSDSYSFHLNYKFQFKKIWLKRIGLSILFILYFVGHSFLVASHADTFWSYACYEAFGLCADPLASHKELVFVADSQFKVQEEVSEWPAMHVEKEVPTSTQDAQEASGWPSMQDESWPKQAPTSTQDAQEVSGWPAMQAELWEPKQAATSKLSGATVISRPVLQASVRPYKPTTLTPVRTPALHQDAGEENDHVVEEELSSSD